MTEAQVGFLCKAAASLSFSQNNQVYTLMRSYYLMRCQGVSKGYGLPEKHFSSKVRCPRCCTDWKNETVTKVKPLKLSKNQRRRIRHQKPTKSNKELIKNKNDLLNSNYVEQMCTFCNTNTTSAVLKPKKIEQKQTKDLKEITKSKSKDMKKLEPATEKVKNTETKIAKKSISNLNVYSSAKDIFSLKDKNNTLASAVKETPKVIKNNKKKKDKFAGLCQKAVLASVKLKEDKQKQNKLNLFLKPSS